MANLENLTGQQILDDFFEELPTRVQAAKGVAELLKKLYTEGKLTDQNILLNLPKRIDATSENKEVKDNRNSGDKAITRT